MHCIRPAGARTVESRWLDEVFASRDDATGRVVVPALRSQSLVRSIPAARSLGPNSRAPVCGIPRRGLVKVTGGETKERLAVCWRLTCLYSAPGRWTRARRVNAWAPE